MRMFCRQTCVLLLALCMSSDIIRADETQLQSGLLPKREIGGLRFLKEHPDYDGRGVTVAIWDTGIDPAAAGLQTTPDGRPKMLDFIDATGDGDVTLSDPVTATDGKLQGLTGRMLTVDPRWPNPSKEFRLGWKAGFTIFPGELIGRLKKQRREEFLKSQHAIATQIHAQIRQAESDKTESKPSIAELKKRLKVLQAVSDDADDPGPVFDCVVFHDGKLWRAVIDTDADGDLRDETPLASFRKQRQVDEFADPVSLAFTVNIADDGAMLSIVTTSGDHGTHVGGIVAAHYPDQPDLAGVAPGAQLISVKIGDGRLGSMETGRALARAARAMIDADVDLVNMSYGEPTSTPNHGALTELFTELVREHQVMFVASAGNAGPALSTVGAPGGTSSAIMAVGAYISPELMATAYSHPDKLPGRAFSWTSRGPTFDGDMGVDVFAPGGAIAPVPTWTLNKSARMNGTSMASPCACGGAALVLSGLKAEHIDYTPAGVMRAFKSTCEPVPTVDVFAQGAGLLQIDRAFALLKATADSRTYRLPLEFRVGSRHGERGILLRDPSATRQATTHRVTVQPQFPKLTADADRIEYELRLQMRSTAPWIRCGERVLLTNDGRTITVHIDPTELPPGAHFGRVEFFDESAPDRPVIDSLPVTVIVPHNRGQRPQKDAAGSQSFHWHGAVETQAGEEQRLFLQVPAGAHSARVRLNAEVTDAESLTYILHAAHAVPGRNPRELSQLTYIGLSNNREFTREFPVIAGRTWELCLSQWWYSHGRGTVTVDVQFSGLDSDRNPVLLTAGGNGQDVLVTAASGKETLEPSAKLTHLLQSFKPKSATIAPLPRPTDRLLNGQQPFVLKLSYSLPAGKPGNVELQLAAVSGLIYDGPLLSTFIEVENAAGEVVAAEDTLPDAVKLGRGRHTVEVELRAVSMAVLKKFEQVTLQIKRPLGKPVSLQVVSERAGSVDASGKLHHNNIGRRPMKTGEQLALHVTAPSQSDLPAEAAAGDQLTGSLQLADEQTVPLLCVVGRTATAEGDKSTAGKSPSATSMAKAVRQAQLSYLQSLDAAKSSEEFARVAERLLKRDPDNRDVLLARLKHLDHAESRKDHLPAVVAAADAVLATFDLNALHTAIANRPVADAGAKTAVQKQEDADRKIVADVLYRKGRALGYMELPDVLEKHPLADESAHDAAFKANFRELSRWVDTTDSAYVLLHVRHERRQQHLAAALELLDKFIAAEEPNFWYHKKRRDIYRELNWDAAAEREMARIVRQFPQRPTLAW